MQQFQLLIIYYLKSLKHRPAALDAFALLKEVSVCTVSSMSHTSWKINTPLLWDYKTKKPRPEPHLDPNSKPLEPQQLPQGQPLPYTASETPTGPLSTRKTQMNPKNEPLDPTTFLASSHKVPPRPKLLLRHSVAQLKQPRLLIY